MNKNTTTSIINQLKQWTDLFCPVMEKVTPLSNKQFLEISLNTLIEMGYTITPPKEYPPKNKLPRP
jgi:hypothetical protein